MDGYSNCYFIIQLQENENKFIFLQCVTHVYDAHTWQHCVIYCESFGQDPGIHATCVSMLTGIAKCLKS